MYPGFVFGFTDNIAPSKTIVCCAGDLLINPTYMIALTLTARLMSSHYLPFVFVRGQMLSLVKLSLSCRCNTSMKDLSGQTSLQKSQINTDSNIH